MKPEKVVMRRIFNRLDIDFSKVKVIVDLGAWIGISPSWFASKAPQALIIAVEPIIENYQEMLKLIKKYDQKNIITLNSAISDKTGTAKMYLAEKSESHSFFKYKRFIKKELNEEVSTITWDDLVDLYKIEEVDLAKVNIEGAELMFFQGMTKVFPKKILLEEHKRCIKNYPYDELLKIIKEKGYEIINYIKSDLYLEYAGTL